MVGDFLVNKGQYSFIHIKSGEVRAGYNNVEEMVKDMIELYKLFNKGEIKLYDITEEFCVVAPMYLIDEVTIMLERELLKEGA